jgi:DnaJ-class molecular chaperone
MASEIECPPCAGSGVENADGWPCPECDGRGLKIINDQPSDGYDEEEEAEGAFIV